MWWRSGRGSVSIARVRFKTITSPAVMALAFIAFAAGYGQFGAVAALGEVATAFGHGIDGHSVAAQAGLSGVVLGGGLAILRLAALGGVALAALSDRWGRRRSLVLWSVVGLGVTVFAAFSPSYWWFVAIFALGRPFLSAAGAITQVAASETESSVHRASALGIVTAGYGLGAGINALTHSLLHGPSMFRLLFLTTVLPLLGVLIAGRWVVESVTTTELAIMKKAGFGHIPHKERSRFATVMVLIFLVSWVSAPASSFIYLYVENVRHLAHGIESVMIVVAALTGLSGLLAGRAVADRWGRRPAVVLGILAIAVMAVVTYSGSTGAAVFGYLAGVFATGWLAPGGTAFTNELFSTEVRAVAAGWGIAAGVLGAAGSLMSFGAIEQAASSFLIAALGSSVLGLVAVAVAMCLPETRGISLVGTLGSMVGQANRPEYL